MHKYLLILEDVERVVYGNSMSDIIARYVRPEQDKISRPIDYQIYRLDGE